MEYIATEEGRRRVHKMYVDVVVRVNDEGRVDPLAVCWPDGRCFRIDEIMARGTFGAPVRGVSNARFRVRFGGHETDLHCERREGVAAMGQPDIDRWWVYARDVTRSGG